MSTYELMDLRATHIETVANFFKLWITATFAAIATAYIVGPNLGLILSTGVLILYIVVAAANAISTRNVLKVLGGLEKDLVASVGTTEQASEAVLAAISSKNSVQTPMTMAVQTLGSSCTCAYLIYRIAGGS